MLGGGGIDSTQQFTMTFLALFGLRGWDEISEIPYLIFLEALPLNYRQFSQWVIPHLLPMAYLRHNRVSRKIRGTFGAELDLDELFVGPVWQKGQDENNPSVWYDGFMVGKILRQQRQHGSWGGYTVSTLFSVAALDHFHRKHPVRFSGCGSASNVKVRMLWIIWYPSFSLGCAYRIAGIVEEEISRTPFWCSAKNAGVSLGCERRQHRLL